jgi:hypothetical protein
LTLNLRAPQPCFSREVVRCHRFWAELFRMSSHRQFVGKRFQANQAFHGTSIGCTLARSERKSFMLFLSFCMGVQSKEKSLLFKQDFAGTTHLGELKKRLKTYAYLLVGSSDEGITSFVWLNQRLKNEIYVCEEHHETKFLSLFVDFARKCLDVISPIHRADLAGVTKLARPIPSPVISKLVVNNLRFCGSVGKSHWSWCSPQSYTKFGIYTSMGHFPVREHQPRGVSSGCVGVLAAANEAAFCSALSQ